MGKSISDLKHVRRGLSSGGEASVLDRGAVITAEDEAMLQALHSRSTGGFRHHLDVLAKTGSGKFMESFYVGYGHKSIGDCGDTTVFIDGVSMLVAKAVQDSPLYSGQEASTRYIDFSKQPFMDPTHSSDGRDLMERQRDFYLGSIQPTVDMLREAHPMQEGDKESVYDKAIHARAFDITRSLLPAGAQTNLSWHTNLRQAADKLLFLRHHPLGEVREVANAIEEALGEAHPNSFNREKRYAATEGYQDIVAENYLYHNANSPDIAVSVQLDYNELQSMSELLKQRPPKTELPKVVGQIGNVSAEFQLDFGSFRDIQRHRAINQRMPLLTTELGFNEWYVNNLPEGVRERLPEHLVNVDREINKFGLSPEENQYFVPMGFNTSNKFKGDLPSIIYMVELRSTQFVHPTLRRVARTIGNTLKDKLDVPIYVDSDPDRFDVKRGEHDIVLK